MLIDLGCVFPSERSVQAIITTTCAIMTGEQETVDMPAHQKLSFTRDFKNMIKTCARGRQHGVLLPVLRRALNARLGAFARLCVCNRCVCVWPNARLCVCKRAVFWKMQHLHSSESDTAPRETYANFRTGDARAPSQRRPMRIGPSCVCCSRYVWTSFL